MSLQERFTGGPEARRLRAARRSAAHPAESEAFRSTPSSLSVPGAPVFTDSSACPAMPEASEDARIREILSTDSLLAASAELVTEELLVAEELLNGQELLAPDRRIRRMDLFISRTGTMSIAGSSDYLVALHIYAGSSLCRAVVTMPYSEAPSDWESWSSWFHSFVGVPSDEAMSVLYYDAEWISDHRDRLLRKALEPTSREAMPFPATAFWRRHNLIESSDIHIQFSM
ncbi:hypothetical protein M3223_13840 [Paenibacillus pasadenensis]|uniref:hypothetical protein n=1 Tax=Paenibacillus pasadenensis TaxID=217090 RepID=UPI00203F5F00|nr:hypothetical protein [Paenibacillus pasadenensis]MCM3748428.1 hypothetical protein [Paenibacillus pasadenensis]